MVDTIVLLLSPSIYHIHDPHMFTPSAHWVLTHKIIPGIISKQNPLKRELCKGIYKPHLTLAYRMGIHGRAENVLKVELSLPKLLFGNNFDELQYRDFSAIVEKLVTILHNMGVTVTAESLAYAPVAGIHYSKNIALTDGSTPYHYINKIKESHVPFALDVNQTDYRNSGHVYKLHSNAYEVVFYDKIRDLEKAKMSEKRAIEKDNALQVKLLDCLRKGKKLEVLRMEVRLNKRQKIKELFAKLDIKADLIFKKLFKPAIAKTILLYYLNELERKRPLLLDYNKGNDKAFLVDLIMHNKTLKPKQIMQLYGLKKAFDTMEPRELRTLFAHHNIRSWQRLMADASKIKLSGIDSPLKTIRAFIVKFKALKIT